METVRNLGQRVKAKYPGQYDDLSDSDLGRAVKAKYPNDYGDFADESTVGMGDVKAAEARDAANMAERERIVSKGLNIPAASLTGDPATDRRLGEIAWDTGGNRQEVTPAVADRALALTAGAGLGMLPGIPAAIAGGALTGGAMSQGDTALEIAGDAALGGAVSGGLAKALPAIGGWMASKLGPMAIKYGRNALGVMSPMARRKEIPEQAVRAAYDAGAIRAGSSVRQIAKRIREATDPVSQKYAAILANLEKAGVYGPQQEAVVFQYLDEAAAATQASAMGGASGGPYASALREAGESIEQRAIPVEGQGRLGLMQSEEMKRGLQSQAATDYVKEGSDSLAGAGRKAAAARMREAIEQAVTDQADLAPEAAASFQPVKEQLHNLLSALGPASESAARASRRMPFGLQEAMGLAAGVSSGNPAAAALTPGLMTVLRERTASTLGAGSNAAARALSTPAARAPPGLVSTSAGRPVVDLLREYLEGLGFRAGPASAFAEDESQQR